MEKIYDVIIVGGGPAGLTAAIYAKRAELSTLLIEKNMMGGGQVLNTYEVDNYPGLPGINGFDLGMKFSEHADKMGVERLSEEVTSMELEPDVKTITTTEGQYKGHTVILATGTPSNSLCRGWTSHIVPSSGTITLAHCISLTLSFLER